MKRRSSVTLSEDKPVLVPKKSDRPKGVKKQIAVNITDPVKSSRISSIKALQTLLLWIFTEEETNPMWINIKYKSLVKHLFVVVVETEGEVLEKMIEEGKMTSVKEFLEEKHRTRHRY